MTEILSPAPLKIAADAFAGSLVQSRQGWFDLVQPCLAKEAKGERRLIRLGQHVWPIWIKDDGQATGVANCYTDMFLPIEAPPQQAKLPRGNFSVLHLEACPDDQAFEDLVNDLSNSGYLTEKYHHFGNWVIKNNQNFSAYWGQRSSRLRNTVKRAQAKLMNQNAHCVHFTKAQDIGAAQSAYAMVAKAGWQPAEPYPEFIPALINWCLRDQCGHVVAIKLGDRVIAAQIWLTGGGRATLFKLTYDPTFSALSPGSVLTHVAIQSLFETSCEVEIDFGRGDDAYKKDWMDHRQQRWGVLACDLKTSKGMKAAAIQVLPSRLKRLVASNVV